MKKLYLVLAIVLGLVGVYRLYGAFFAKPYGEKISVDKSSVYYTKKVTKDEAEKTAAFLKRNGFYEDGRAKDLQLDRSGDTVLVRMVIEKEKLTPEIEASLNDLTTAYSDSLFAQKPVNLHLCNNEFETYRTVAFEKREAPADTDTANVTAKEFNGSSLHYDKALLTDEQAEKLGTYLVQTGFFGETKLQVMAGKTEGKFHLSYPVKKEAMTPDYKIEVATYALAIKQAVFNGEPFVINLCNDDFSVIESVPKAQ